MDDSDYEAVKACNCLKDERKRLAVRRYAGVFVVVLPCGHIVTVHHLVGAESLPQVAYCFAQALNITAGKRFICYDNACALARFCRNPVRAAQMQIFRDRVFVLPESHLRVPSIFLAGSAQVRASGTGRGQHRSTGTRLCLGSLAGSRCQSNETSSSSCVFPSPLFGAQRASRSRSTPQS